MPAPARVPRHKILNPDAHVLAGTPSFDRGLPEDQRGSCMVCGAGFFEHLECKSGDCHFVRAIEDGLA